MRDPDVDRHLPLKAVDFHILLVLAEEDRHGYGIVKEIESRSDGRLRLEPGNLYRYIRRLADEGLVEPADRRRVAPAGRIASEPETGGLSRRRYYRVTARGREVLAAEAARMRALALAAETRLASGGRG